MPRVSVGGEPVDIWQVRRGDNTGITFDAGVAYVACVSCIACVACVACVAGLRDVDQVVVRAAGAVAVADRMLALAVTANLPAGAPLPSTDLAAAAAAATIFLFYLMLNLIGPRPSQN